MCFPSDSWKPQPGLNFPVGRTRRPGRMVGSAGRSGRLQTTFWLLIDEGAAQSGVEWRDPATPVLINFIYHLSSSMSIIHSGTFFC